MSSSAVVAHVKTPYLPLTETFIYGYASAGARYEPVVVTAHLVNLDQFRVARVKSRRPPSRIDELLNRWSMRLLRRQLAYEAFFLTTLREIAPRVVHAHFGPTALYLLPVMQRLALPMVTSFYGHDLSSMPRARHWQGQYTRLGLFSYPGLCTVEGPHAGNALQSLGCPPQRIRLLEIPVDLKRFPFRERHLSPGETARLLCCGRLVPKKGWRDLLQAARLLKVRGVPFQLTVLGDGPERSEMGLCLEEMGLTDRVHILGFVRPEQWREMLLESHVLVVPSRTDPTSGETEGGAPTVLVEGQASGIPIVATRHADIPWIWGQGEPDELVPEGDAAALSEGIEALLRNPAYWPEMGRRGRAHVEARHDRQAVLGRLEEIYDQAIDLTRKGLS